MSTLKELKNIPTPSEIYEREHETYNEDNVKESLKHGRSIKRICSMLQVSEKFVRQCLKELQREGWKI